MTAEYGQRCREIAKRFLLTAVVVDDEPYFESERVSALRTPGRRKDPGDEDAQDGGRTVSRQSLDAMAITEAFAEQGMICGIVVPYDQDGADAFFDAVRRADVVVVDWQLRRDDGRTAVALLKFILAEDQGERLRLIAIYTGEDDLGRIGAKVAAELKAGGLVLESEGHADYDIVLARGHCRIAVYAKHGTGLTRELSARAVGEKRLADQLIGDFAGMVEGLLPSIALTALGAVRENAHKLLGKFEARLDAAYLTHRSCLPSPGDSEQHMVEQVASELHGIMDDAVAERDPAGVEAIELWLEAFKGDGRIAFAPNKTLNQEEIVRLVGQGLDAHGPPLSKGKDHAILTSGFSRDGDGSSEGLDLQLASMMCFRTVFDKPNRVLRLGTALRKCDQSQAGTYYLCMRPHCESVRLTGRASFLLLPLADATLKTKTFQIVVPTGEDDRPYRQVSVVMKMSEWLMIDFQADSTVKSVVASGENGRHYFTDVRDLKYEWIGELKSEFAHGVAHALASDLSRVALNKSEWLRRSEGG